MTTPSSFTNPLQNSSYAYPYAEIPRDVLEEEIPDNYDTTIPRDFICPLSRALMEHPATVDCSQKHVFERQEIESWRRSNPTCPIDQSPITQVDSNHALEATIRCWRELHAMKEINTQQLARYILFPGTLPGPNMADRFTELTAYLRFVQAANKTQQVAIDLALLSNEEGTEILSLEKRARPYGLDERAWATLRQITQDAQIEQCNLSPRSIRAMHIVRSSQASMQARITVMQTKIDTLEDRVNTLTHRQQQQRGELAQMRRSLHSCTMS